MGPKYALEMLGIKYLFSVGNPSFKGIYLVGRKQLGQPIKFSMKAGTNSNNINEHFAVSMYLTKENLKKPGGLADYAKNFYIIQQGEIRSIAQEALH